MAWKVKGGEGRGGEGRGGGGHPLSDALRNSTALQQNECLGLVPCRPVTFCVTSKSQCFHEIKLPVSCTKSQHKQQKGHTKGKAKRLQQLRLCEPCCSKSSKQSESCDVQCGAYAIAANKMVRLTTAAPHCSPLTSCI